jgi:ABC-type hemin transport system ATPase subunit
MVILNNYEDLIVKLDLTNQRSLLIGIDGRPCAGKSTLAGKLIGVPSEFGKNRTLRPDKWAQWPEFARTTLSAVAPQVIAS